MRKLSRQRGPRKHLLKNLVSSLILYEGITTTHARSKEVRRVFARVHSIARTKTLSGYRQLRASLTGPAAKKMQETLGARLEDSSGALRITSIGTRSGDNAPLARVELIAKEPVASQKAPAKKEPKPKITPRSKQ